MPETMATYLGQVESASVLLEQVKDRRHRVRAIEVDIQQYRELVEPLAEKYAVSGQSNDPPYIAIAADALVECFDAAREGVNLRKQNRELANEAKQDRARREHHRAVSGSVMRSSLPSRIDQQLEHPNEHAVRVEVLLCQRPRCAAVFLVP